jgi:hypothetical protein
MKIKLFTLFVLAALLVSTTGTVLAQGPAPSSDAPVMKPAQLRMSNSGSYSRENALTGNLMTATYGSITNGTFEQGDVGWSEYSSNGWKLVVNKSQEPNLKTHAGNWSAWLGGDDSETSAITQSPVTISSPGSKLYFWYFVSSLENNCTVEHGYVVINNTDIVYTWNLCVANATTSWQNLGIDLSAYNGQQVTISFVAQTDGVASTFSNLFIDDISLGGSFADVPTTHTYFNDVEILYANGLTGGCAANPLKFCPDQIMNRGQTAVFMLRGNFGSSYVPPVPTHIFQDDWSKGTWAEPWAEGMKLEGLSAGCLVNPPKYCPWDQIPREQAVIFALRMKNGKDYTPPPATGTLFADMTNTGYYATAWAEQAYLDGLIPNCGTSGGKPLFCPKTLVSRGLGAYMIVRAKSLTMP